jgi:hypothetical protein
MTAGLWRASLDAAAPFGASAAFHEHRRRFQPTIGDAAVESRASIGTHATLYLISQRPGSGGQLAVHRKKICRSPEIRAS